MRLPLPSRPFSPSLFRLSRTAPPTRRRISFVPVGAICVAGALAAFSPVAQSEPGADFGATPAGPPLELKLDPQLNLLPKETRKSSAVYGVADKVEGSLDTEIRFEGNAELRKPGMVLKADNVRYVDVDDEVFAKGTVRIVREGDVYTGPELRIRLDDNFGYFLQPEYTISRRFGRGRADRADFLDKDRSHLTNGTYTTCTAENADWHLQANSLDIDQNTQTGKGRNGAIYFKGLPILAFPWITFPLNDQRQSGLLAPSFGVTSNNGIEFLQPYYWNIAPNRDLTAYPKLISRRGIQLGADFRYLEPSYRGDLRYETLPNDRLAKGRDRYALFSTHQWIGQSGWLSGWSSAWNVNSVSDDNYFVDFSRTIAVSSQRTLPRLGTVTYGSGTWYVVGQVLRYQTLQDPNNPLTPPYEKLPELLFHGAWLDRRGFDFNFDAALTRFWHPTLLRGDRLVVNPSVAYPILRPGWFVTPKFSYHATEYSQVATPNGVSPGDSTFHRALPTFSVDSGLNFERDVQVSGRSYQQTLEPRLFYVHTPYRDQSRLPNFDSALADFNFSQIFSENSFVGSDRIADANQVTAALTTRFIDPATGAERLRAAIGQRFYLTPQRVTLPGGTPVDDNKSDFLVAASGETLPNVFLDTALEYSPALKGVARSNLGVSWRPGPTRVVNAEYRYVRNQIEQVDVSGQWPVTDRWYAVGRMNYATREHKVVESVAGVEYKSCCWVARFVTQRYATGATTATTSFFMQLELNGLGHIGSSPLEALKRNIPGYQAVNPPLSVASPFRNYE